MEKKKILSIIILCVICSSMTYAKQWYEGGTLHNSTFREWKAATYQNKLATCADYLCCMEEWKEYIYAGGSMSNLKEKAERFVSGLNEFCIGTNEFNFMKINEIAAAIYVMANDLQPYSK